MRAPQLIRGNQLRLDRAAWRQECRALPTAQAMHRMATALEARSSELVGGMRLVFYFSCVRWAPSQALMRQLSPRRTGETRVRDLTLRERSALAAELRRRAGA